MQKDLELKIFSGSSNPELAKSMADYLQVDLCDVDITRFPEGEIFVKIRENIRGRDVFIVQSVCMPPNENLMELLIMIDAARRASADRITAVIPFYGYGRQDRKDQPRVPITAKLVANLLVAAGANRILSMDFHAHQIQGFFDIPVDHLYAAPVFVKYIEGKYLENPVVVSPDPGSLKMALGYSQRLKAGVALVAKKRKGPTEVEAMSVVGDVEGCSAIMVDDMSTTAGTLCEAANLLRDQGATSIIAAVSHASMVPMAFDRLRDSPITELVVTDSIPLQPGSDAKFPITVLTIAGLLAEAVMRIHANASVTSLFEPDIEL